jgi:hypothetical protein
VNINIEFSRFVFEINSLLEKHVLKLTRYYGKNYEYTLVCACITYGSIWVESTFG